MTDKVTGDITNFTAKQKFGVTLHNFPQVTETDLADAEAIINVSSQSGKRLGAQVCVVDSLTAPTEATIYAAAGNEPTSVWVVVAQLLGTGAATVTPA